ncbi:MAG: VWA domain-containing protein [Candidatus Obscuribacter sp.]|nr:VWA domain-containing protein [Candidatus Obscuribacter sp.]
MQAIANMHWVRPDYLYALLAVLPAMAALLYFSYRQRLAARKEWGEEKLIERFTRPFSRTRELIKGCLWLTATALVVLAAAGPLLTDSPIKVKEGSMRLIAVVDVSPSMAAEDYRSVMPGKEITDGRGRVIKTIPVEQVVGPYGSRLDMAKYVIRRQIMPTLEHNKIGIVNYTGQGFVQAPLTDGYEALSWMMDKRMGINQAPGGGSDYAEGLKTALEMFKTQPQDSLQKVILLFTDGGFTGDPEELTKVLAAVREQNIRIIVVGMGSTNPTYIPKYSADGQSTGFVEKDGEAVKTAIDEAALQTLVSQTGGDYIRLDPDSPPRVKIEWARSFGATNSEQHDDPIFQYPLGAALLLMGVLMGIGLVRREKIG